MQVVIDDPPFTHDETIVPRALWEGLGRPMREAANTKRYEEIERTITAMMDSSSTALIGGDVRSASNIYYAVNTLLTQFVKCRLEDGGTLEDLTKDQEYIAMLSHLPRDTVIVRTHYHIAQLYRYGHQVYEVSQGLAEILCHTEAQDISASEFVLPHPSIYVRTDPTPTGPRVWNDDTQWHAVIGVYLAVDEIGPARRLNIMVVGEDRPGAGDALQYWSIELIDHMSLVECVRRRQRTDKWPTSPGTEELWRWIINVVVYATSADARAEIRNVDPRADRLHAKMIRTKKPKRRKAIAAELSQLNRRRYTSLGAGLPSLSTHPGTGKRLESRHVVGGHWKQQPYGPKSSQRKWILIAPYLRGPEDGQTSEVVHRLK